MYCTEIPLLFVFKKGLDKLHILILLSNLLKAYHLYICHMQHGTGCFSENLGQLPYMTCFIKEVLRFYNPVPATSRILIRPLALNGKTFPRGQIIDININTLHHNPAVWGDDHNVSLVGSQS